MNQGRWMSKMDEMTNLLACWNCWYYGKSQPRRFSLVQRDKIFRQSPNLAGTDITFIGTSRIIKNDE